MRPSTKHLPPPLSPLAASCVLVTGLNIDVRPTFIHELKIRFLFGTTTQGRGYTMELRLSLTEIGVKHLNRLTEFQKPYALRFKTNHMVSSYYDTPDQTLARAGFSLHVRRDQNAIVQILKTTGTRGARMDQNEWKWPLRNDQPDPSLLPNKLMAKQLPPLTELKEIFATDIERQTRTLQLESNTTIEASLDEGTISTSVAAEPVRELKLELQQGAAGPMYRLASRLHKEAPLSIIVDRKATRGLRLASGEFPEAQKAVAIKLLASTTGTAAFQQVMETGLYHLLINEAAALAEGVEGVHQMRVAIRRLRALLALYKPKLDAHNTKRFDAELKRIGRLFGQARDWDVFCTETLLQVSRRPELADCYDWLSARAASRRKAAHQAFATECRNAAFTAVILDLAAWAGDSRIRATSLGSSKLEQPLKSLAPKWLNRLADKVDNKGKNISSLNNEELHEVRKSLKKLRYGIEFIESLFPRNACRPYLKHCKDLLDVLGVINDTSTSVKLAMTLFKNASHDWSAARSAFTKCHERRHLTGTAELKKTWTAFQDEKRFWA
jgi:triphosphatase